MAIQVGFGARVYAPVGHGDGQVFCEWREGGFALVCADGSAEDAEPVSPSFRAAWVREFGDHPRSLATASLASRSPSGRG